MEANPDSGNANGSPSREPALPSSDRPKQNVRLEIAAGFAVGTLTGMGLLEVGFGVFLGEISGYFPIIAGVLGAIAIRGRGRIALQFASAIAAISFLIVSYTPIAGWLIHPLLVSQRLGSAPAVVVLASDIHRNGDLNAAAQARFMRAYELLHQGYAKELVVTRLPPISRSYIPTVTKQFDDLGLKYPITEVGRVYNTHDEAQLVAKLAKERGWKQVLLVTQAWHMRRAMGVFERAGVSVLPAPCPETSYELYYLKQPGDRRWAFRDWLHEFVGLQIYKLRGWV